MKISVVTELLLIIPAALLISSEKILAASGAEEALAKARTLMEDARRHRFYGMNALTNAANLDNLVEEEMKEVSKLFNHNQYDPVKTRQAFMEAVEDVKSSTTYLEGAAKELATREGKLRAAISRCEEAATSVCTAAAGPPRPATDATGQQEKFAAPLQEAIAQLAAAKEAIKSADVITGETLRAQLAEVVTQAAPTQVAAEAIRTKIWNDAVRRIRSWEADRASALSTARKAHQGALASQKAVEKVLAPFRSNPEARALLAEVAEVVSHVVKPPDETGSEISYAKRLEAAEDEIERTEKVVKAANVEALSARASGAIEQITKIRQSAQTLLSDTRGEQAAARGKSCLAQIQSATPAVAQASPSPAAADEVIVPNLSVFESVSEMKAALVHADLAAALVAAKERAPSKEKEFKFAGQDPAPGTRVKRGTTVSIAFYQKFEPGEDGADAASSQHDEIVGRWSGTFTWPGGATDPLTIQVQKRGNGYEVIGGSDGGKVIPATYANGVLSWMDKGSVGRGKNATFFDVKVVLRLQGDALTGTLDAGAKPAAISLRRN